MHVFPRLYGATQREKESYSRIYLVPSSSVFPRMCALHAFLSVCEERFTGRMWLEDSPDPVSKPHAVLDLPCK